LKNSFLLILDIRLSLTTKMCNKFLNIRFGLHALDMVNSTRERTIFSNGRVQL